LEEIRKISSFAHENGILMHLDGARLWNASIATGIAPAEYAQYFDSVSVCFSKGLELLSDPHLWDLPLSLRGLTNGERSSAEACGKPALSLPVRCMLWSTIGSV